MTFWGSSVGSWRPGRPGPDDGPGEALADGDGEGDGDGDGAAAASAVGAAARASRAADAHPASASLTRRIRPPQRTKLAARFTIGFARKPRITPMMAPTMSVFPRSWPPTVP